MTTFVKAPVLVSSSLIALVLLTGCMNQKFAKKQDQTNDQYRNDMMYCKSEAVGAWDDRNGMSDMNIQTQQDGQISYEECMLQMGYKLAN